MKLFIFLVSVLSASLSLAKSNEQYLGTYYATGTVMNIESTCPPGAECIIQLYKAELLLHLRGCVDEVINVSSSQIAPNQILVKALVGATRASLTARCIAAPNATAYITIADPNDQIIFYTKP